MKKIRNRLLAACMAVSSMAFSQVALPTSYDFNNFAASGVPAGWTTNIPSTNVYASSGVGGTAAIKFSLQSQYLTVFTANSIGTVIYNVIGNFGSPATSWSGTFDLQESVAGTTWTTLMSHTALTGSGTIQTFTVTPNASSRYLRWFFTTKVSGSNVGLDDVSLAAAPVTAQEINVKQGANTIFSGGATGYFNSAVATPTTVNLSILNEGTVNTLSLTSMSLSGPAAADYSVTAPAFPSSVAPSSNVPLNIMFTPSSAGTRDAVLTIINNDSDEGTYVINLKGIGGSYATQPAAQGTALTFSGIKSYRASAAFTAATGAPTGYLIIKKESSAGITEHPTDGKAYMRGDSIGACKVIYTGTASAFGLSNIYAGKQYQIAIFTYNGGGAYTNYNTTSPLTGNFTALGSMQPVNEYNGISTANTTFLTDLTTHTYPHTSTFYGDYDETMVKLFSARDTTAGQKVVTCVYSSENYVYTEPFAWGYMSREHSYAHNWMPSNPADSPERPEYSDQHHLFPTNQNNANAARSNYPEGDVVGTPTSTYLSCKSGLDSRGKHVFEPRANHKGDFARAIMYMATAYNGQLKGSTVMNWKLRDTISATIPYNQDQNVLKKWHFQDPPDSYEISRNDFLDSLQGNRNPFIDSAHYACYIDFSKMTYIAHPTYTTGIGTPCYVAPAIGTGIADANPSNFEYVLAPNPTSGSFTVLLESNVADKLELYITDVTGRTVYTKSMSVDNGFNTLSVTDHNLGAGIYFVNLNLKSQKSTRKLIIQ